MKICKYCQNEIPELAKKCGHCHEWQKWHLNRATRACAIFFVVFIALVGYNSAFSRHQTAVNFGDHSKELSIIEPRIVFGKTSECKEKSQGAIVGYIENTGDLDWDQLKLELKIMDEKGKVVDGDQIELYSFSVGARSKRLFNASLSNTHSDLLPGRYSIEIVGADRALSF